MLGKKLARFFRFRPTAERDMALDGAYLPLQLELAKAGLSEEGLRQMDPDERVAALEQARLDPYDFIYLAC